MILHIYKSCPDLLSDELEKKCATDFISCKECWQEVLERGEE
jgi:hypothetical protein